MNNLIKKLLNKETIIYVIFGVLTTVVDFYAFGFLHYDLSLNEVIANTIAWAAAVLFAFITNKLFVFNSKSFERKELIKEFISFVTGRIVTLVLTDIFLIFARFINMHMMFAKALISVVVIILNYIFSKLFVFNKKTTGGKTNE